MNCYIEDCDRKAVCKSLCDKHYRRLLKRGCPNDRGSKKVDSGSEIQRFNSKLVKCKETGCWLWIGGTRANSKGVLYGRHHTDSGKSTGAHRFSYAMHNGEIPDGKYVCHRCDTPLCVNPDHLFIGSHQDNMTDMVNKERSYKGWGESKSVSKLTNEQAMEIYSSTLSRRELANIYSVSLSVIGRIKRKEAYFGNSETVPE